MVQTVLGPVDRGELGRTLVHEHVFVHDHELERTFPGAYGVDRELEIATAVSRLRGLAAAGFGTIVDMTVLGLGREVELLRRVAEQSPVRIVAATGAYVLRDLPHPLQLRGPGRTMFPGPDPMVQLFVADITEGIEGTAVRAGILKCATDRFGLTKDVERTLRAVAKAQVLTGAPIYTHTNASKKVGLDQQRVFAEEGVDLGRVVIGHSGDTDDLDYLQALLDQGSYLGMDRFGLDYFLPLQRRVEVVAALCARGYASQLLLSHDSCCANIAYSAQEMEALVPGHNLTLIDRTVLPELRARGVSEADIRQMVTVNPAQLLEPEGSAAV
jgi:phosphotriesterase-related protein